MGRAEHPSLSVVVVTYRMMAQIGNTLRSLIPPYQRAIAADEYEIILIDNGSPDPLPEAVWNISESVRYIYLPPERAHPSPGPALNAGVSRARAPIVCLMIDGADAHAGCPPLGIADNESLRVGFD